MRSMIMKKRSDHAGPEGPEKQPASGCDREKGVLLLNRGKKALCANHYGGKGWPAKKGYAKGVSIPKVWPEKRFYD